MLRIPRRAAAAFVAAVLAGLGAAPAFAQEITIKFAKLGYA